MKEICRRVCKAFLALAVPLVLVAGTESATGTPDASARPLPERTWLDQEGRVVAWSISPSQLLLYSREAAGRIVRIEFWTGSFDRSSRTVPPEGNFHWVHLFEYDKHGRPVVEMDCRGVAHSLEPRTSLKSLERIGTLLTNHRHPIPAPPTPIPAKVTKFEYDVSGRIAIPKFIPDDPNPNIQNPREGASNE